MWSNVIIAECSKHAVGVCDNGEEAGGAGDGSGSLKNCTASVVPCVCNSVHDRKVGEKKIVLHF